MDKKKPLKVVDLEMSEDGIYTTKKKNIPAKHKKFIEHGKSDSQKKYLLRNDADEFLNGIDAGLDLLDQVIPRVGRFLKLGG